MYSYACFMLDGVHFVIFHCSTLSSSSLSNRRDVNVPVEWPLKNNN